jgi:hypothetical protein
MWVHYADQHKGFVIGFDTGASLFTSEGRTLKKVKYDLEPPLLGPGENPSLELCRLKAKDWEYEQEWRCFQQFKPGTSRDIDFETAAVKEIIVGSKIADPHLADILLQKAISDEEDKIVVSKSYADRDSWKFSHRPFAQRLCPECGGSGYR